MGEAEKNSFIALPGKGGHSRLMPTKPVCPNPGRFGEAIYGDCSRVGLMIRLVSMQGLQPFNLVSGDLEMSSSGSFNLASGDLLWNEEC